MPKYTPNPFQPELPFGDATEYAPWVATYGLFAPYGKCQCGCQQDARISAVNEPKLGNVVGLPVRFIRGHSTRLHYLSLEDAFRQNVAIGRVEDCWEWQGALDSDGYGQLKVNRQSYKAHRLSYLVHFGEIKRGIFVCHSCDNPRCVNPNHLWLGSALDNNRDAMRKGRRKPVRGEQCGSAKLDEARVVAIREEVKRGIKQTDIAVKYGISSSLVSMIANRKVWRHVE